MADTMAHTSSQSVVPKIHKQWLNRKNNVEVAKNVATYTRGLGSYHKEKIVTLCMFAKGGSTDHLQETYPNISVRTIRKSRETKVIAAVKKSLDQKRTKEYTKKTVSTLEKLSILDFFQGICYVPSGSGTDCWVLTHSKEEAYILYRQEYPELLMTMYNQDSSIRANPQSDKTHTRAQQNLELILVGKGKLPSWPKKVRERRSKKNGKPKDVSIDRSSCPTVVVDSGEVLVAGRERKLFSKFAHNEDSKCLEEILVPGYPVIFNRTFQMKLTSSDLQCLRKPDPKRSIHSASGVVSSHVLDFCFLMIQENFAAVYCISSSWINQALLKAQSAPKKHSRNTNFGKTSQLHHTEEKSKLLKVS